MKPNYILDNNLIKKDGKICAVITPYLKDDGELLYELLNQDQAHFFDTQEEAFLFWLTQESYEILVPELPELDYV